MQTHQHPPHRDTIAIEQAEIIDHQSFAGDQYILTVRAEQIAKQASAGQFVHIQCSPDLPLRRPLSIMQASPSQGSVAFLYKVLGVGTQQLSQRKIGESISLLGPIGNHFIPSRAMPLLIGGGVGIPPMIFLAETLAQSAHLYSPFVIMGSEVPFPFTPVRSTLQVPGIDNNTAASMPLLEEWGIANRLTSKSRVNLQRNLQRNTQSLQGCFDGYVTELATLWLETLSSTQIEQVEIFSCGPHAMLSAVAEMAKNYNIPCQVSLEEYMACAVGGCAGCVVEITTSAGQAMKRVCVDGPIFDSRQIFSHS